MPTQLDQALAQALEDLSAITCRDCVSNLTAYNEAVNRSNEAWDKIDNNPDTLTQKIRNAGYRSQIESHIARRTILHMYSHLVGEVK